MTATTIRPTFVPAAIPLRELAPWLLFGLVFLAMLYFVGAEEGLHCALGPYRFFRRCIGVGFERCTRDDGSR